MESTVSQKENKVLWQFTIFGVAFGLCFPIVAISIDLIVKEYQLSLSTLQILHRINPIHYIIDSAPFILAATAFFIGKIVIKRERKTQAELARELRNSQQLIEYVQEISQGNYDITFQENNETIASISSLLENLRRSEKEQQVKAWHAEGMSQYFSLLHEDSSIELLDSVLSLVIEYVGAVQGNMYTVVQKDHDWYLKLATSYAFYSDEEKEQLIPAGMGTIGQMLIDKEVILQNDLPKDYIKKIVWGTGNGSARSLLMVPLLLNDEIYGVIEVASFNEIEKHHVTFVQAVGENLAMVISSHVNQDKIQKLVDQYKYQANHLSEKELIFQSRIEQLIEVQQQLTNSERSLKEKVAELERRLTETSVR